MFEPANIKLGLLSQDEFMIRRIDRLMQSVISYNYSSDHGRRVGVEKGYRYIMRRSPGNKMKDMNFGTDLFLVYSVENRGDYDKIPAENKQKVSCE